jgi:hypothetical protein
MCAFRCMNLGSATIYSSSAKVMLRTVKYCSAADSNALDLLAHLIC